jgi:6-phosphogluconolactonase
MRVVRFVRPLFLLLLALINLLTLLACGGGSSSGGGGNNNPPPAPSEFLYATTGCCVAQLKVNASTGILSQGSFAGPFTGLAINGYGVVVNHAKSLLLANGVSGVFSFSIDKNGGLTRVSGSPAAYPPTQVFPFAWTNNLALAPSGNFVYAPYDDTNAATGGVAAFAIESGGQLTPIPGSPFAAGNTPTQAAVDPAGKFLYVLNSLSGISVFSINATDGSLTEVPGSPFPDDGGYTLAIHPSGKYLYVPVFATRQVSVFSVDRTSGTLSPVPGSPFPIILPNGPFAHLVFAVIAHPSGLFVYVADLAGNIYGLRVDQTTGALTQLPVAPQTTSNIGLPTLAIDTSGKYLYATSIGDMVSFQIDPTTGALTPIGSPAGFQNIGIGTLGLGGLSLP